MKIIFLGNTAVHASLIAANIYLGNLKDNKFQMLKGFGDIDNDTPNFPVYIGRDEEGAQVYTLAGGRHVFMVKKSLEELRGILGCTPNELLIKAVSTRWDGIISFINRVPSAAGGNFLKYKVSNVLLRQEYDKIYQDTIDFKSRIRVERKNDRQCRVNR